MKVGVIGLGYVGLPLCLEFVRGGAEVVGFDVDAKKIEILNEGESYIEHISASEIESAGKTGLFESTTDFQRLDEPDAILIAVPTPLDKMRQPDLMYVERACVQVGKRLRKSQLVVLESTTYPGTTREVMLPILEEHSGLKAGEDFYLAYSPEREDPGREDFTTKTIPKVVGGINQASLDRAVEVYKIAIDQPVPVTSCEAAEAAKILENTYRCVNIAMINELKMLFDRMGIDVWEVIRAAATKPFGFTPFYPGPGLGGHCIPIDPFYLSWKAKEYEQPTRFIELAGEINRAMPEWVVFKIMDAMNDRGKALKDSKILLLGLAYKPNVDDCRESPSFKLWELLAEKGAEIEFSDPHVPEVPMTREYAEFAGIKSQELTREKLETYDCVVIATHHNAIDFSLVVEHAKCVVDTRNATAGIEDDGSHIIKA